MTLVEAIELSEAVKQSPEVQQRLAESKFGLAFDGECWREMTEDEFLEIEWAKTKRKR
jgi:hypothetical protein